MVRFATAMYDAGFAPLDGKSFDEIISDFDLCFRFIGQFKDSYSEKVREVRKERSTREWLRRRQDDIHSNRCHGEVEISPLMRAALEYDTKMMNEYFGPESMWRWDGL